MEYSWELLALLFIAALAFIYNPRKPEKKLPPGPRPWPIIGNLNLIGLHPASIPSLFIPKIRRNNAPQIRQIPSCRCIVTRDGQTVPKDTRHGVRLQARTSCWQIPRPSTTRIWCGPHTARTGDRLVKYTCPSCSMRKDSIPSSKFVLRRGVLCSPPCFPCRASLSCLGIIYLITHCRIYVEWC
ncbi:cytochrome p450 71a9 [Phtheirospermum japonicum]|uniref:Cytochrome p450 71a9 n=1 Tax=Phtheirospermum japonicum TaxID=374723 RepID=A0A830CSK8_9LAMI|nr:cytochrome p450 71a9 [Phtheirospermum japonicum]